MPNRNLFHINMNALHITTLSAADESVYDGRLLWAAAEHCTHLVLEGQIDEDRWSLHGNGGLELWTSFVGNRSKHVAKCVWHTARKTREKAKEHGNGVKLALSASSLGCGCVCVCAMRIVIAGRNPVAKTFV